jgi:hypothetical protein
MHAITCPRCGAASPEKINARKADPTGGFFSSKPLMETTCVYRCECGTTFMQSASDSELLPSSIASMDAVKRESLIATVNRLQREVGRIVDSPSCLIVGYDGQVCIAEIRTTAQQCEAAGMHEAAERLDQLGRDVMRRWAE